MNDVANVVSVFENRIREELPGLAASVGEATPDGFGNYAVLECPWPPNPSRCRLGVLYRGDCFDIAFSVAEARGPAERQVIIDSDLAGAVEETIDFLRGIVSGLIVVDVFRYRFLWFQPYYLAFFREERFPPKGRVVETLRWAGNGKVEDMA